jgi:uncharacterized coiled-coil DUF342 family protein
MPTIDPALFPTFVLAAAGVIFLVSMALGTFIVIRADVNNKELVAQRASYPELKRLEAGIAEKSAQFERLSQDTREVEARLVDLRREQAEVERHSQDANHWQQLAEQAKRDYDALGEKIQEVDKIRDQYEEAKADLEVLRAETDAIARKRDALNTEIGNIAEKEEEARRLESLVQSRQAALEAIRLEISQAEDQREQLARARFELDQLARRKDHLEERSKELATEISDLLTQRNDLQKEIDGQEDVLDSLNRAKSDLETLRTLIASHTAQKDSLNREIERLETVAKELGGVSRPVDSEKSEVEVQKALEDLFRKPTCLFANDAPILLRRDQNSDEMSALEKTGLYLEEIGLEFDNALIEQFHTSLKIGQISPLTVLAGISGTGKSQLPQRYAEAMGIPFLKVPVQPRWDSPQDLLGFYNYLEKRYSATELARALLHMDTNPAVAQSDYHSMNDRMLLVLLDEMNLARVEYYFSEFLSRLEGRPSAEETDADRLRASRIEIEIPGVQKHLLSIYPGHNLLFVGTMNEDESTQALSDKVMDRANIIRFPKPDSLSETQNATSQADMNRSFLPYDTWRGWYRAPRDTIGQKADEIQAIIDALNEHLAEIRRPFGHRINQAIFTYIANHPRWDNSADYKTSLSEMLEMRVLPKLRGIELSSDTERAIKSIENLVQGELDDDRLAQKINLSKGDGMFTWNG